MSRIASKLSRRIMAAALSVVMIMSSMPVYATELSDDPIPAEEIAVDEGMENVEEAAELVENVEENTQDAEDVVELTYDQQETDGGSAYVIEDAEPQLEVNSGYFTGKVFTGLNTYDVTTDTTTPGFGVENFGTTPYNNGHGIVPQNGAKFILNLEKKSNIIVIGCAYGQSTSMTAVDSEVSTTTYTVYTERKAACQDGDCNCYTILDAVGTVVLTLNGGYDYIHSITVEDASSIGKQYAVSVTSDANGTVSASPAYSVAGTEVTLTVTPKTGFALDTLTVKDESDADVTVNGTGDTRTFTMPSSNVTVNATFVAAGVESAITAGTCSNGSVTVTENLKKVEGETVVVSDVATVTPDTGWHFKAWKVTDASNTAVPVTRVTDNTDANKGKYVFTMPGTAVTISAEFEADDTELRKVWVFAEDGVDFYDNTIWGMDNNKNNDAYNITVAEGGDPVIAAGLKITKGTFKTVGRVAAGGYAQVSGTTVIEVPVAGPCKVTVVTYQNKGCTVDGKSSETGTFNCEGTDNKVTIAMNSDTAYLTSIKVEPATTYTITLGQPAAHATATAVASPLTSAAAGAKVELSKIATVAITSGEEETYEHTGWEISYTLEGVSKKESADKGQDGEYTFTMPAANVTVTPVITEKGQEYDITLTTSVEHASVEAIATGVKKATAGKTVKLNEVATVTPDSGYKITGWTVEYEKDGETITVKAAETANGYTFDMPAAAVTVTPVIGVDLETSWNFNDGEFVKDSVVLADGYNGLVFSATGAGKNTGSDGTTYLTLNEGGTVQIPIDVTKDWAVKVGYSYAANAIFEDEENASIHIETTGGSGTAVYYHAANADLKNAGYVTVTGLAGYQNKPTYITNINVVPVAKGNINVVTEVDHATVSTTDKLTYAFEGQTVKLSDVADVTIATADVDKYEVSGWSVKYGQTDVTVNKTTDGYSFVMPAGDVTVTPLVTEKVAKDPYPTWNFSSSDFQDGTYAPANNTNGYDYKGLLISAGNAGAFNNKYLQINNGTSVSIPVQGNCTITVTTQFGRSFYFALEGIGKLQAGGSGDGNDFNYPFDYTGEAGYVVINATNATHFTKIVVSPLAQKHTVTVDDNVANATVTKVENAPTEFTEGRPVKLNDLVTSVVPDDGFEFNGWEVTQTVSGDKVEVAYNETDGYTFTMPEAAVTVKPIINPVAQDRTVTVALKAGEETLEATDLERTVIVFEDTVNLTNKKTVTVGTDALDAIALKDGTYTVTVYNSKLYWAAKQTDNDTKKKYDEFTVSENNLTCTINFDKNPKHWDFREGTFQTYYSQNHTSQWYDGLTLTNVFINNAEYAKLVDGSKIIIPVTGECNVTVTYFGGNVSWLAGTVGNKPYTSANKTTYHYQGDGAGVVEINCKEIGEGDNRSYQASVQEITITDPVAAPVFSPKDTDTTKSEYTFTTKAGDVVMNSADSDATVKYVVSTDYTDDAATFAAITEDNILEAGDKLKDAQPVRVSANGTVIKAVAVKDGMTSKLVSYTYNVTADGADPVDVPVANPAGGTVAKGQEVTLTAAEGVEIYYTLNNMEPTTESQKYDKASPIKLNTEGDVTLKAIAVKGDVTSTTITCTYKVVNASKLNSVSISGKAKPGETLTARPNFTGTPGSNTTTVYKWYKVTVDENGAEVPELLSVSDDTYTIPETGFVGAKIRVEVTFTNELGVSENAVNTTATIAVSKTTGNGLEIEFDDGGTIYTYTGAQIKPSITVTNNGYQLVEGTDYTVKYTNNINASVSVNADGTLSNINEKKLPTITVTGKGSLTKKITANFKITPKGLTDADDYPQAVNNVPSVKANSVVVFSGKKATPVLLYGGAKLAVKKNYTVESDANKKDWEAGDKITLKGTGNFTGTIEIPVSIATKDDQRNNKIIANFKEGWDVKNLYYTGEKIEVPFTVSSKSVSAEDLTPDVDYVISYPSDLVNVGTKKVTITGISSKCIGTVTKAYSIKPAKPEAKGGGTFEIVSGFKTGGYDYVSTGVTFTGENAVDVVYKAGEVTSDVLVAGKDYKITYTNNKKAGATNTSYTITGLGNYKGVTLKKQPFTIKPVKLILGNTDVDVTLTDMVYTKDGVYKAVPYVTVNGELLKASEYVAYYTVNDDTTNTKKGSPRKIVEGDFVDGVATVTVRIDAKSVNTAAPEAGDTELTETYKVINGSTKTDLTKAKVVCKDAAGKKTVGYTGNEVYPATIEVTPKAKGSSTLTITVNQATGQPTDATLGIKLTYASNKAKGKATVVITAEDTSAAYVGGQAGTFSIVAKDLGAITNDSSEGFVDLKSRIKAFFGK